MQLTIDHGTWACGLTTRLVTPEVSFVGTHV